jgi:hypothetical protein
MAPRDMGTKTARLLVACAAIAAIACSISCAPHGSGVTSPSPAVASAQKRSTQVDFRDAAKVVLAYIEAVRSADATATARHMTAYRREETRAPAWKSSNAWWKTVRVSAVSRPGHYLSDERTFAQLYAQRLGHGPYKLIVLNVAYSAVTTAPAGDIDFVVTKDSDRAPWLIDDFGGAVFPH